MFRRLDGGPEEAHATTIVEPMRNGPLRVTGEIHVRLEDGTEETLPRATLCRCGDSARKPFCDNTHLRNGFLAPGEPFKIRLSSVRPHVDAPDRPCDRPARRRLTASSAGWDAGQDSPAGIPVGSGCGSLPVRLAGPGPLRRRDPSGLGIGEVVRRRTVICGQGADEHGVIGRPDPGDVALSGQPVTPDRPHVISTAGASPVTGTIRACAAVPSPRITTSLVPSLDH